MVVPYASYFFAGSSVLSFLGVVNVLTLIGVPLLALILYISKHIFKSRTSPSFKAGMWAFWVVNIVSLFALGSYQGSQFRGHSQMSSDVSLLGINSDTLQVRIESDPYQSASLGVGHLKVSDGRLISRHVHLNVERADADQFELVAEHYSRGRSESEAVQLMNAMKYEVKVVDNTVIIPRIIEFPKGEKWRNQQISLTLKVPEGKSIYLHNSIWSIGHHIDVDREREYPNFESDQTWVMESNGLVNHAFIRKSQRSDEFDFKNFEHLQLEGMMKVIIKKGSKYNIAMTGRPHYLDRVEVAQLDKTLSLSIAGNGHIHAAPQITITMPELKVLEINKTENVDVQGFTQNNMRIKHRGRETLEVFAKIDSLHLRQSERSKTILRGQGVFLDAALEKRTELDADRFSVKSAKIHSGISSEIRIAVSDSLLLERSAGARIEIDGSPVVTETQVTNQ